MEKEEVKKWGVEEMKEYMEENFGEEVAEKFVEAGVDGETGILLATSGLLADLQACGLHQVKDCITFRQSFSFAATPCSKAGEPLVAGNVADDRKLKKAEVSRLRPEEKRTYLIKRKRVQAAARQHWPGNNIPIFKGRAANRKELDNLVAECSYSPASLPGVHFGPKGIAHHLLDCLNERRRRVHKGHDYEMPLKRVEKAGTLKEGDDDVNEIEEDMEYDREEGEEKEKSDSEDMEQELEEKQKKEQEEEEKKKLEKKQEEKRLREREAEKKKEREEEAEQKRLKEREAEKKKERDEEKEHDQVISMKSAEVIIMCAFQAHRFKDISRTQIFSSLKSLNKAAASELRGTDKASLARPLAAALLKGKTVKVVPWAKLSNLSSTEVEKVGTF